MLFPTIFLLFPFFCNPIFAVNVDSLCGAGSWTVHGGNCYKLFVHEMTYEHAKGVCQAHSSNLASIHSQDDNDFVAHLATTDFDLCTDFCESKATDIWKKKVPKFEMQPIFQSYWIGLHRVKSQQSSDEYICKWDDGTKCDYGNVPVSALREDLGRLGGPNNFPWSTGQPSGNGYWKEGPPESCTHFWWKTGWWNDVTCNVVLAGAICKKPVKC